MEYSIEVLNEQESMPVDAARFREAVGAVLQDAAVAEARIEILVVDDAAIQPINARFLGHDAPTDVVSFVLEREGRFLEGQIVLSAETAQRNAEEYHWPGEDEMLLYLVHGTLHLVGYEDTTEESWQEMRSRERKYLAGFGLTPPWKDDERIES